MQGEQGHLELDATVGGVGDRLAVRAHLEPASSQAFRELAEWLDAVARGDLVARYSLREKLGGGIMIETMIPKSNALNPRESLSKVVQSLLVLTMTGCCRDIQYSQDEVDYEGVIEGELLDAIRAEHAEPADRCEAACLELILDGEPEVEQCEAAGASNVEDPWAPENVEVTIMCVGVYSEPVSCSGRPSGHL